MLRLASLLMVVFGLILCIGCGQPTKSPSSTGKPADGPDKGSNKEKSTPKDNGGSPGSAKVEDEDIENIVKKLGGTVERDKDAKGQPIRVVRLNDSEMSDAKLKELMPQLEKLSKLRGLDLSGSTISVEGFKELAALANLERLDLDRVDITSDKVKQLVKLKSLKDVSLRDTSFPGASLPHLTELPELTSLNLANNKIKAETIASLAKAKNLRRLEVTIVPFTDDDIEHLAKLKNLTELILTETKIEPTALKELREKLPKCEVKK